MIQWLKKNYLCASKCGNYYFGMKSQVVKMIDIEKVFVMFTHKENKTGHEVLQAESAMLVSRQCKGRTCMEGVVLFFAGRNEQSKLSLICRPRISWDIVSIFTCLAPALRWLGQKCCDLKCERLIQKTGGLGLELLTHERRNWLTNSRN